MLPPPPLPAAACWATDIYPPLLEVVPGTFQWQQMSVGLNHKCGLTLAGDGEPGCGIARRAPGVLLVLPGPPAPGLTPARLPCAAAVYCWGKNQFGQASGAAWGWRAQPTTFCHPLLLQRAGAMLLHGCTATCTCCTNPAPRLRPIFLLQCGTGGVNAELTEPTPLLAPDGATFGQVQAGDRFTCVRSDVGEIFCFGGATAQAGGEGAPVGAALRLQGACMAAAAAVGRLPA